MEFTLKILPARLAHYQNYYKKNINWQNTVMKKSKLLIISNYKCNQDLHVIVGMQFFFFSFHSVLNVKLQDQLQESLLNPLVNQIEQFNGVYAQNTPCAFRLLSELYLLTEFVEHK